MDDDKIIHIPAIIFAAKLVLYEMVKIVQINVAEKL